MSKLKTFVDLSQTKYLAPINFLMADSKAALTGGYGLYVREKSVQVLVQNFKIIDNPPVR